MKLAKLIKKLITKKETGRSTCLKQDGASICVIGPANIKKFTILSTFFKQSIMGRTIWRRLSEANEPSLELELCDTESEDVENYCQMIVPRCEVLVLAFLKDDPQSLDNATQLMKTIVNMGKNKFGICMIGFDESDDIVNSDASRRTRFIFCMDWQHIRLTVSSRDPSLRQFLRDINHSPLH